MPAVSAAARRAKRVIESDSESQEEEMELDDDVEDNEEDDHDDDDDNGDDDDGDGDDGDDNGDGDGDDDAEGEGDDDEDAEPEEEEDEIDDDDDEGEDTPQPVKIKLRVDGKRPAKRQAAKKAAKRTREDVDSDDEFREDESRATSPSKMTARQRAKREKELGEDEGLIDDGLLSLPDGQVKVKPILTEAERLQKREEMARRRKRQNEQRLQDEQDQTINRLLRAQTGRSRSKLDHTPLPDGESGASSPTKQRSTVLDIPNGIRWVSRLDGEKVTMAVSVMEGNEKWLELPAAPERTAAAKENSEGRCGAKGCSEKRKYRSTKKFDVGGCSLPHLKEVEAAL